MLLMPPIHSHYYKYRWSLNKSSLLPLKSVLICGSFRLYGIAGLGTEREGIFHEGMVFHRRSEVALEADELVDQVVDVMDEIREVVQE